MKTMRTRDESESSNSDLTIHSHRKVITFSSAIVLISLAIACILSAKTSDRGIPDLPGRIVAAGIPGISGITVVGTFHPGGPLHDKAAFRIFTEEGAVLAPERILVTSTSNFGASLGRTDQPPGSVLSIDPQGTTPILVPREFAAGGGQVTALGGRLILFTANSPAFLNRVHNPQALTADSAPVSNPTAISLNNAFGRIWVTSVPSGFRGPGIHSILDPDGCPLDRAPNKSAGGVFTGSVTNRQPQVVRGSMETGALATALLGKSPDGSGRAVFAALHTDGSLTQLHTEYGVDGLAPAGTIKPIENGSRVTRAGMAFNWIPNPILYVTDPMENAVVALSLQTDAKAYHVQSVRRLTHGLNLPVDVAPVVPEIASSIFSSNTTVAGDSDVYVVNRGDGTLVRLKQDGTVVAIRRVALPGIGPLGADRLNGIAVSSDSLHIWVAISGALPGYSDGALIELPAFGGSQNE
jgi:hypothetical protein